MMDNEYVRCGGDTPCSVASDLRARVRELEEKLNNERAEHMRQHHP